jgi:hypothetical protein
VIQSVLPTSLPSLMPVDSLLQSAGDGAEALDFAALLASGLPAAATSQTQTIPAAPPALAEAEMPQTATAATATGNILPPTLPFALPLAVTAPAAVPALTEPEAVAEPEQPASEVAALPTAILTLKPKLAQSSAKVAPAAPRRDASRKAAEETADPADARTADPPENAPAASAETTANPVAAFQPTDMLVALPDRDPARAVANQQHPALTAAPLPPAPAAEQAPLTEVETPRNTPTPRVVPTRAEPAPQALAEAAPQAAFRRSAPVAEPVAAPQAPISAPTEARPVSAPLLRVEIAQPAAAQAERPGETRPTLRRSSLTAAAPVAAPVLAADPSVPQPAAVLPGAAAPVSATALRPHDFAAVVDRLVAAREAVQPHAATLTVSHADFGAVQLRFRHEERGLAVSLASADPDFVRAAAAAPQPVMPTSASAGAHTETGQSAPQREPSASTAGSSGGQSRGQQGERRGDQFSHSNQPPRGSARPGSDRRSGIFA